MRGRLDTYAPGRLNWRNNSVEKRAMRVISRERNFRPHLGPLSAPQGICEGHVAGASDGFCPGESPLGFSRTSFCATSVAFFASPRCFVLYCNWCNRIVMVCEHRPICPLCGGTNLRETKTELRRGGEAMCKECQDGGRI